jgi:hypothetical protein
MNTQNVPREILYFSFTGLNKIMPGDTLFEN